MNDRKEIIMSYKDKKMKTKKQNEWIDKNCDKINLLVPKGQKEIIRNCAQEHNMNMTKFIRKAINNELSKNGKEISNV